MLSERGVRDVPSLRVLEDFEWLGPSSKSIFSSRRLDVDGDAHRGAHDLEGRGASGVCWRAHLSCRSSSNGKERFLAELSTIVMSAMKERNYKLTDSCLVKKSTAYCLMAGWPGGGSCY